MLAMMSVLDDTGGTAVLAEARRLNMDCIVEVHDERELQRALALGAAIIGINNRDLATMATDIRHTFRLVDMLDDRSVRRVLVSESGISGPDDLRRLRAHGVNIVLVGEHLMRQPDPGAALRDLLAA